jgi:GAF domain-containing protein
VAKALPAAAEIQQLVARAEQASAPLEPEQFNAIADKIANAFGVAGDEVAVLAVAPGGKYLRFLLPEKLRTVGTIPLTSTSALAARTVRERRAEIQNNFGATRHASVFEGVPLGRAQGDHIQKIMSAPIVAENKAIGVIQISRKGRSVEDSGADFRSEDLRKLQAVATSLARFVQFVRKN